MPPIPEMDEFVNWDNADPAVGSGVDLASAPAPVLGDFHDFDLDLALENVEGDDFSFWALQHYENSNLPTLDPSMVDSVMTAVDQSDESFQPSFETPEAPCAHCQTGGYQCKKIREGKYKGYCTSCVALRCECSFGLAAPTERPTDSAFPYNPWPVMGDHPEKLHEADIAPSLLLHSSAPADKTSPKGMAGNPKVGARFSRESVRILKNWLSTHNRHPYPTEDEKEMLQKQTGLNKTQITNWLANARRRGKVVAPRSTSPGVRSWSNAIDIPHRRGTPLENMNPLQRWQNSPPENEPASLPAIARAVSASTSLSSGLNSPHSQNFTDDGSGRSIWAGSSASSVNTSHSSGGSFNSAYSHASRGSYGSMGRGRRRRRRKAAQRSPQENPTLSLVSPLKTFQCTFCTETFRTKHDWQRHEKSLHLSLERWVCAPDGTRALNPENNQISCVFCGEANPDEAHIESHNYSSCLERSLGERTFYRKDHLRQHLKLFHNAKFMTWSMEAWKVTTPEIQSRCGFCGMVLATWSIRVDHLAEHFKTGYTMADWKGDWGFDQPVLNMVENSIPPYLIHDERNTPYPYSATRASPESHRNAFELVKNELVYFMATKGEETNRKLTDEELLHEACRIVFGAEVVSNDGPSSPSWLRDLIMSNSQVKLQAQMAPIRSHTDSLTADLRIKGKNNIFEDDPMEKDLHEYVKARRILGLTAMDSELQVEACRILSRMEELSTHPSEDVANFLVRLIYGSTEWLSSFRQRAVLPRSEDVVDPTKRSKDPSTLDSTIHNYSRLESELAEFVKSERLRGVEPSDVDLQKQARIIIYEYDDGWNQTAADNEQWLNAFKQRHVSAEASAVSLSNSQPLTISSVAYGKSRSTEGTAVQDAGIALPVSAERSPISTFNPSGSSASPSSMKIGTWFLNDANCYRRLARELTRYVASTMSPNNPNSHVPSDEELQHQARWILYDDDDPWNQTAADNFEWLRRFKRDVGILSDPSLPGLPEGKEWNMSQGGTGFAPPYAYPNPSAIQNLAPFAPEAETGLALREGTKVLATESDTACKYIHSLCSGRREPPAVVFCSRELENGLVSWVTAEAAVQGGPDAFPSDDAIRARARDIVKASTTPADDPVLLDKFKTMMREKLGYTNAANPILPDLNRQLDLPTSQPQLSDAQIAELLPEMDLAITDSEITDILQDMNFEFANDSLMSGMSQL